MTLNPVDRAGNFRAKILEYGLKEADSGAVCVQLRCELTELWNAETKEWDAWPYEMEASGDLWVVTKEGKINKNSVESLTTHCGWDGDFNSISNGTWNTQHVLVQVQVGADEYKGVTRYRIEFVNAYDRTPGGAGITMPTNDKTQALQTKYGAQLRAIAGTVKRNAAPPPASRPAAPPPPVGAVVNANGDDIPY